MLEFFMREIELKIALDKKDSKLLKAWLDKNAKFVGDEEHKEIYFDNPKDSFLFKGFGGIVDSEKYLRVRENEKGCSVCLKIFKIYKDSAGSENLDEIEYEVSSFDEARKLFNALGFKKEFDISKSRKKYLFEDFEIVIDKVKGLGEFAEVELLNFPEDVKIEEGWSKIYQFAKKIGFKSLKLCQRGYLSMIWNGISKVIEIKKL